jgi:hypothetical protein
MELTITSVDYAPPELNEQVPFKAKIVRMLPGPDRPDYWLGELESPLFWIQDNRQVCIDHVVLCARWQGTQIEPCVRNLPVGIAYVTDKSLLTAYTLGFEKCAYVAIGLCDETSKTAPTAHDQIQAGIIGRAFGKGTGQ